MKALRPSRGSVRAFTLAGAAILSMVSALHGSAWAFESVGMNVHDGSPESVAAAAALGVKWIRVDGNWDVQEPADDAYVWYLDAAVTAAQSAGLSVFMSLGYTPAWVPRHGDTDGEAYNDVPDDAVAWSDFVTDAVVHYRALGVRHFGLWNEANLDVFFQGSMAEYSSIIAVPGAAAVRAACMDCLVLGPELAHVGASDDMLEAILTNVPAGTFDIVTHHDYGDFVETGWHIWDGDSFINVLDQQRFPFTRRSLRQVLDGVGYTGDVWITETGYRAQVADAADEDLQAVYVRRVLEEQLARAWYANTFFYEMIDCGVDQPGCPIDGYGLVRPTQGTPGSRAFPADFRLKPAFLELQSFIQNNPAIVDAGPARQCGDGQDNDGDGRVDLADRGCADGDDDDESDDPPRPRLVASELTSAAIDGDLSELGSSFFTLPQTAWHGVEPLSSGDDHSVSVAVAWLSNGLLFGVEAQDDVHENDHGASELWMGDSVQIAFDLGQSGGLGYDGTDDHELGFALTGTTTAAFRFHGPAGAMNAFEAAVVRSSTRTRYEILVRAAALPGVFFSPGTVLGFSFLVNDADGAGRVGWTEWTPGIGVAKEPEYFGEIAFAGGAGQGDAGAMADATGGSDGAEDGGTSDVAAGADATSPGDGALDADVSSMPGADAGPLGLDAGDGLGGARSSESDGCGCAALEAHDRGSPSFGPVALVLLLAGGRRRKGR